MTLEEKQQFDQMKATVDELQGKVDAIYSASNIPYEVEQAIRTRFELERLETIPAGLRLAPLASITAPSGGLTVDSEARTAINLIITRMESLEFVDPN